MDAAFIESYDYILEQSPAIRTFSDSEVSESQMIAPCPTTFDYEVMLRDEEAPLDPSLPISFNSVSKQVLIETGDRSYLSQSPILMTARFKYQGDQY